jgi:iron(III) transport system ATP-binding protein
MEIYVRDLSKSYRSGGKQIQALSGVSLEIQQPEIFTLLGPSGCGKTTLLRCLVGLETPDTGEISIGDRIVFSAQRGILVQPEKRGLGMVFQSYAIWPHMTVQENVAYPLKVRGEPRHKVREKVARALSMVKLEGMEARPATQLSGGQQQRVALARALVAEPRVILFDEPLSNLDAKLRDETRKELRGFLAGLKITAVYVTHDRMEALSLSDRVAVMKDGSILETGSPEQVYFHPRNSFVAEFIGKANMIQARVLGEEGPYTLVHSQLGRILCRRTSGLHAGEPVTVCIRPEFLRASGSAQGDAANLFRGKVLSVLFLGDSCEVEVQVAGQNLLSRLDASSRLKEGEQVTLAVSPEQCFTLAGQVGG